MRIVALKAIPFNVFIGSEASYKCGSRHALCARRASREHCGSKMDGRRLFAINAFSFGKSLAMHGSRHNSPIIRYEWVEFIYGRIDAHYGKSSFFVSNFCVRIFANMHSTHPVASNRMFFCMYSTSFRLRFTDSKRPMTTKRRRMCQRHGRMHEIDIFNSRRQLINGNRFWMRQNGSFIYFYCLPLDLH